MLEKSLDVLRSKELSFGCHINVNFYDNKHFNSLGIRPGVVTYNKKFILIDKQGQVLDELWGIRPFSDEDKFEIIGHPLTRGRLYHLCHGRKPSYLEMGEPEYDHAEYNKFYLCFENIKDVFYTIGFDKTELERMQNDKWNELYPLLVEFSTYFKHE